MTEKEKIIRGTGKWYRMTNKIGTVSGRFSVKQNLAQEMPLKNGQEVIIEVNTETGDILIKGL
jgi:hypothetical protein